jgi:hypothetical protein
MIKIQLKSKWLREHMSRMERNDFLAWADTSQKMCLRHVGGGWDARKKQSMGDQPEEVARVADRIVCPLLT